MDKDVAIKVDNVSKKYCKSLKRSMLYGVKDIARNTLGLSSHSDKLRKHEFWALDDISFEVKKGETLGIIGPNGSGKTTLLKLLNGIFWPDKGRITVKGKVGALIEVGAGFHPLLTGRENIYINAAILGMDKKEVDEKFDDIVEFADIGDFLDAPVKHYSSGMFVRLGFAVAVHCEPDILLVDEVLAVGDINFQHRCLRYMTDVMSRCTVILVNHNPDIIRFACQRVLFLNNGKIQFLGSTSKGVEEYVNNMMRKSLSENNISQIKSKYDPRVEVTSIELFDKNYSAITELDVGESLIIKCSFTSIEVISKAIVGVAFYLDARERSFICYSSQIGQYYNLTKGEHTFQAIIPNINLKAGVYHLAVIISEKSELASHTWNSPIYIVVKNPCPEHGFYNMKFQFAMDKERIPSRINRGI